MKKAFSILLIAALVLGLFTGCSQNTQDAYQELQDNMGSVKEATYNMSVDFTFSDDENGILGELGNSITSTLGTSLGLEINGTTSYANKQTQASITLKISSPSVITMELTDMIIDGNVTYINMGAIADWLGLTSDLSSEETAVFTELMGGSSYIKVESESGDVWSEDQQDITDDTGFLNMIENIAGVIDTKAKEAGSVSSDNGVHTLSLSGAQLNTIVKAVLANIEENLDAYIDAVVNYITQISDSLDPAYAEDVDQSAMKDAVTEVLGEIKKALEEEPDLYGLSYSDSISYDKGSKTYQNDISLSDRGSFQVACRYKVTESIVEPVSVPSNAITMDEYLENIEALTGSSFSSDFTNTGTTTDFPTVETNLGVSLLNQDLADYGHFINYPITDRDGTEYLVPIPDNDFHIDDEYYVASETGDGLMMLYSFYDIPGNSAADLMSVYVDDNIYSLTTYYQKIITSLSDLYVSPDGSSAFMSLTYEEDDSGKIVHTYYSCLTESGKTGLLLEMTVVPASLTDEDEAILSELSQLIGYELPSLY